MSSLPRDTLTEAERARLLEIIQRDGLEALASRWGLSREPIVRLAAGLSGRNGSVALVRIGLADQSEARAG